MWALVKSNKVSEVINQPKSMTIGDVQYPRKTFSLWSASELQAIGIMKSYKTIVIKKIVNTTLIQNEFSFSSGTVTASYGTATAKSLNDTKSGADLVKGLKTLHKETVDKELMRYLHLMTGW